jgi:hypothetical protein
MALALTCAGSWAQAKPQSGHYDSATLAVSGDRVTGVFSQERGDPRPGGGPQFSCIFLLEGTLNGSSAKVDTWAPGGQEQIPGTLTFTPDGGASLKLADDHGGCGMTVGTMSSEPYTMARENDPAQDWIGAALVNAKHAILRAQPGETTKRTPYIVQYDPVAITERKGDWVRVRYYGEKGAINGWVLASELAIAAAK